MKTIYLRAARKKAGLTQVQLAEKAKVQQGVISKLERHAGTRPVFETVVKLADALDVDPRQLRFGQPESISA